MNSPFNLALLGGLALVALALAAVYVDAAVGRLERRWRRSPAGRLVRHVARNRRRARPRPRPVAARPTARPADAMYRACPLSTWTGTPGRCRWCNRPVPALTDRFCGRTCRHLAEANHYFDRARPFVLIRDGYTCADCGTEMDPQVNHIDPCLGRHREPGCWHHVDGLNVLCGPAGNGCHQAETNRQRAAGLFEQGRAS